MWPRPFIIDLHDLLYLPSCLTHINNNVCHVQVPLLPDIIDMVQSGFVEYSYFTGMPRYRDLFRTSSQWWAYNDCVSRFRHRHRCVATCMRLFKT
jgi:hypothetical protein